MAAKTLFVGIGSDYGDDRAGWLVAEELAKLPSPEAAVRCATAPIDILDWLDGVQLLGICDACRGAGPIGSWHRWKWPTVDVRFVQPSSTHDFGLLDTLRLAALLETLPEKVLLWGIEIASNQPGNQVASEIHDAIRETAHDVKRSLHLRSVV